MEENDNLPLDKTDDNETAIPEQINQMLENASPENREEIEKTITQTFAMMTGTSPESTIMKKITSEHITQYLNDAKETMELSFKDKIVNKKFIFGLVVIALIFIIIIIILLKDRPTLLEHIIYAVIGFVAGAFGGYGFGRHKQSED